MTGAVVSMTSALLPARESLLARAGSVRGIGAGPSWMVAPLRASEVVAV